MFGSYTNWLAVLGCCSIVFLIICVLKLFSMRVESERSKAILQLVYGFLSVITIIPTVVFAYTVQLLCKEISYDLNSQYVKNWTENDKKYHKKEIQKAYDNGLEYGMWLANPDVSVLFTEIRWLLTSYRDLYKDYKDGIPFSDIEKEYTKPEHFFHDDLPHGK